MSGFIYLKQKIQVLKLPESREIGIAAATISKLFMENPTIISVSINKCEPKAYSRNYGSR